MDRLSRIAMEIQFSHFSLPSTASGGCLPDIKGVCVRAVLSLSSHLLTIMIHHGFSTSKEM